MSNSERFTSATGAPVPDNTNILTAGRRGPALLQDIWLIEKLAHFDREVIPECKMHAKGWGGVWNLHDDSRHHKVYEGSDPFMSPQPTGCYFEPCPSLASGKSHCNESASTLVSKS